MPTLAATMPKQLSVMKRIVRCHRFKLGLTVPIRFSLR
jgi:hypothetical protein